MKVSLQGVCRSFGALDVLRSVTADLAPGEVTVVLGTNGAGKTTLLRLLGAVLRPTSGEIRYDDQVLTRARLDLRRRVMFVADSPLVLPESPLIAWVGTCLRVYAVERPGIEALVTRHLDDLDLTPLAGLPLATLSRGQLYKAALTALMAVDPDLWLLDEPFASGIDPSALTVLIEALRSAASRGRTVVVGTQLLEMAGRVADRVLILRQGSVAVHGPLKDMGGDGEGLERMFRELQRGGPPV